MSSGWVRLLILTISEEEMKQSKWAAPSWMIQLLTLLMGGITLNKHMNLTIPCMKCITLTYLAQPLRVG